MSSLKSGAILLLLAIPVGLYVAWQVQGVTRADLIVSDPPSDKGLPDKDRVAAGKARAEKWATDVKRAAGVALDYRQPAAGDLAADKDCNALAEAAAKRAAPLANVRTLLGEAKNPQFVGSANQVGVFQGWHDDNRALVDAADGVEAWFDDRLPLVDGRKAAGDAYTAFDALLTRYAASDSPLKNRGRVAGWRVRARARLVAALADAAEKPYKAAVTQPFPLPATDPNVKPALAAVAELKEQLREVEKAFEAARKEGLVLAEDAAAARTAAGKVNTEWKARDELLVLYTDTRPLADPAGADDWLRRAKGQYEKTQSADDRKAIRQKVQEFCAAFVPPTARLDAEVLINDKPVPRRDVTLEYVKPTGDHKLSDAPDGLNEFNFLTHPDYDRFDRVRWQGSSTGSETALKGTVTSHLAHAFSGARKDVKGWSPAVVRGLKKKCEARPAAVKEEDWPANVGDRLNRLVGLSAGRSGVAWDADNTRLWDRLTALEEALARHPELIEAR